MMVGSLFVLERDCVRLTADTAVALDIFISSWNEIALDFMEIHTNWMSLHLGAGVLCV